MRRTPNGHHDGRLRRRLRPSVQRLEGRELLTVVVGDGGFEAINLSGDGSSGFYYNPTGSPWTFNSTSGLIKTSPGEIPFPQGQQAAFVQESASISQDVPGWTAGDYQITFAAAQRYGNNQDFQVLVDGAVVGTFQPSSASFQYFTTPAFDVTDGDHTITFQGTDTATGDNTVILDAVSVTPATAGVPVVNDPSFEQAPVADGNYTYDPQDSYWDFGGTAGVSGDDSGFTGSNPDAPDGSHVAFLQGQGSLIQAVTDWSSATYQVSFEAAQRGTDAQHSQQDFEVMLDGNVIATFTPTSAEYQTYTTPDFTVGAGTHALTFVGLDTVGGDNTAFLDDIGVTAVTSSDTVPEDPDDLTANAISSTEIDLNWLPSDDAGGYSIERSPDGQTGWTPMASLGADASSYSDTDLVAQTHYYYRAIASNDVGNSDYSNVTDASTLPATPTDLAAAFTSDGLLRLSWQDNSGGTDGFVVEQSPHDVDDWQQLGSVDSGTTTFSPAGVYTPGQAYDFRVRAVDASGDESWKSNVVSIAAPSPELIADRGFEDGGVLDGTCVADPTGSAWTFSGSAGIADDRDFDGSSNEYDTPQGKNVAYLGDSGSISQTVNDWPSDTPLQITAVLMAVDATQILHCGVYIDGRLIGQWSQEPPFDNYQGDVNFFTSPVFTVGPGEHTVTFTRLPNTDPDEDDSDDSIDEDNATDGYVLLDDVTLTTSVPTSSDFAIADPSFEAYDIGAASTDPGLDAPLPWTFSGKSGVAGSGSPLTIDNPPPPDGSNVAYISGDGEIDQDVVPLDQYPSIGNYQFSFSAAQRFGNATPETFEVVVDEVNQRRSFVVGTFTPSGPDYQTFLTQTFGFGEDDDYHEYMVISIVGINSCDSTSSTVLIDNFHFTAPNASQEHVNAGYLPQGQSDFAITTSHQLVNFISDSPSQPHSYFLAQSSGAKPTSVEFPYANFDADTLTVSSIIQGNDGGIYFVLADSSNDNPTRIGRLDLGSGDITYVASLSSAGKIGNLVRGSGNLLWFVEPTASGSLAPQTSTTQGTSYEITSLDVTSGDLNNYDIGTTSITTGTVLAPGPDDVLWFPESSGQLARLNEQDGLVDQFSVASSPSSSLLAVSGDGKVWFNSSGGTYGLACFDPDSQATTYYDDNVNSLIPSAGGDVFISSTSYNTMECYDPTSGLLAAYNDLYGYGNGLMQISPSGAITVQNGFHTDSLSGLEFAPTPPLSVSADNDRPTADNPVVTLDASIGQNDLFGDPEAVVQWNVLGTDGTIEQTTTTTVDGDATTTLHVSTEAGEPYYVYAKVVATIVDGITTPVDGETVAVPTITVVPGQAAQFSFSKTVDHLISDGKSTTRITVKAADAYGNTVPLGDAVEWDLSGTGFLLDAQGRTGPLGNASVTLQAGDVKENQTVTVTIDGVSASLVVKTEGIKIQVQRVGGSGAIDLGTNDWASFIAIVTDEDGNSVPNGTKVNWYTQKGTFQPDQANPEAKSIITTETYTSDGSDVASAILTGLGGSQIPGPGNVRAFVGNNSGATSFAWVTPSTGNLTATLGNYVIAGDRLTPTPVTLIGSDGTQLPYDIPASATGTVHGKAGAVVTVQVGFGDRLPPSIISLSGDPGSNGTTVKVTLDGAGNGNFTVNSPGNVRVGVSIPLTLTSNEWPQSKTTVTIALIPVQLIEQACDRGMAMGWAVATGNDNGSVANTGADIAFSMIPVVGSYTDIRDITKEMLKLIPSDPPSQDRFSWRTTLLSGTGLLLVGFPPFKWVPSVIKKLLPLLRADSIIGNALQKFAVRCDFSKLSSSRLLVQRMVDPSDEAQAFCKAADKMCVTDAQFESLITTYKAFGENADDFESTFLRIVNDPTLGMDAARRVVGDLSKLSSDQIKFLRLTGRLDNFANNVARGDWSLDNLQEAVTGAQNNWKKADGSPAWPPDNGFLGGEAGIKETTLAPGTMIDRYGNTAGSFVSPAGTPYPERALRPGTNNFYPNPSLYEVTKPVEVQVGKAIPWFDEPGGGIQYKFDKPISDLLDDKTLVKGTQ